MLRIRHGPVTPAMLGGMEGAASNAAEDCGPGAEKRRYCSFPNQGSYEPAPMAGVRLQEPHSLSLMENTFLVEAQNRDGGWPYRKGGGSWTEPTAYALLAQLTDSGEAAGLDRGLNWLRSTQRSDGGWSPTPSVLQSTWVTALVALLPPGSIGPARERAALNWLMSQKGEESTLLYRIRNKLLGNVAGVAEIRDGWPFYPGAAAWVTPTALTVLALEKIQRAAPSRPVAARIELGRQFLLDRMCLDGGWNYGRSNVLGVEADSYPETTGVALLALHGAQSAQLPRGIKAASEHLRRCRSAEAMSWLMLALDAHGEKPDRGQAPAPPCRTVQDQALAVLAKAAGAGRNLFLG